MDERHIEEQLDPIVSNVINHAPTDDTDPNNNRSDEPHRGNDPPGEISNSSSYGADNDNNDNEGIHPNNGTLPETKYTNPPGASSKISPGDALEQSNRRGVVMFGDVLEIREGSDTQTSSLSTFEKTRAPNRKKLFMPYERINPVLPNADTDSDSEKNDHDLKPRSQTDE
jgi:hypothetical protein